MSDRRPEAETEKWLRYAREDLETAQHLQEYRGAPPRQVCAFAQQAAEKALKAALIAERKHVPRTHDLVGLDSALTRATGIEPSDLAALGDWGVKSRHPEDWSEPSAEDAAQALALSERVVEVVNNRVGTGRT